MSTPAAPPRPLAGENTESGAFPISVGALRLPPRVRRVWRYLCTSGVSTVVSEVTLIAVLAIRLLPAPAAAMAATLTGGMVSYALSRYWIWADADRRRAGLQLTLYWAVAAAGMLIAAAATDFMADHATGPHPVRVAEAAAAYLATYGLLWIAKFLVYQRVIFRPSSVSATLSDSERGVAERPGTEVATRDDRGGMGVAVEAAPEGHPSGPVPR